MYPTQATRLNTIEVKLENGIPLTKSEAADYTNLILQDEADEAAWSHTHPEPCPFEIYSQYPIHPA